MSSGRSTVLSSGLLGGRRDGKLRNKVLKQQWHRNNWLMDFKFFAGSTTAHGVNQIFVGRNKLIRLIFLLTWLCAVCYTCYSIMQSIITFVNKPTGTKYEVIVNNDAHSSRPQTIRFPTITICSHNKVKKSFLMKEGNENVYYYWNKIDMYDESEAKKFNWSNPGMEGLSNWTYQDILERGGPSIDRFLSCFQRNKLCSDLLKDEHYLTTELSQTGRCWRVNPKGSLFGKGGDYGKMQLMMFADLQDYTERSADQPQYGFTVAFHDYKVYGSTISSGYFMSPGSVYKVDLRLKKEIRTPPPGGNCNASLTETTYGAYHEGACVLECKDRAVHEKCGCVNVVPPLPSPYRSCTLQEWATCGLPAYLAFSEQYRDPKLTENICPCASACSETYYEAQLSSSTLSRHYTDTLFKIDGIQNYLKSFSHPELGIYYNSSQDIFDNLMVLEVLFSSMATSEIVQVVTYTSNNLLGDIGGVLGLFLGASVFTIIEFFQFITFAILKHCGKSAKDDDEKEEVQE